MFWRPLLKSWSQNCKRKNKIQIQIKNNKMMVTIRKILKSHQTKLQISATIRNLTTEAWSIINHKIRDLHLSPWLTLSNSIGTISPIMRNNNPESYLHKHDYSHHFIYIHLSFTIWFFNIFIEIRRLFF